MHDAASVEAGHRDRRASAQREAAFDRDDAEVEAARADPRRFAALYERHWPVVYRYLRARTSSNEDAADLAATTFERALVALPRYRTKANGFASWLMGIARNAAIDAARRRATATSLVASAAVPSVEPAAEVRLLEAEQSRELRALIDQLPDVQRDAVLLRYAAGLGAREIGSVIGKSEAATQKLLTRALAHLKESCRDDE